MFDHSEETQGITLDDTAKAYMLEMGRWGKFLAIVTIIMLSLMVLLGIATMTSLSSLTSLSSDYSDGSVGAAGAAAMFGGVFMFFFYIVIIAIYVYPTYALYKYSTMVKLGIMSNDQYIFNEAFRHLKGAFKYIGIFTLIIICIYALIFLFTGVGMFFAS